MLKIPQEKTPVAYILLSVVLFHLLLKHLLYCNKKELNALQNTALLSYPQS